MTQRWLGMVAVLAVACTSVEQERIERTIALTVENRTGWELWYFQYSDCGAEDWWEVIGETEYVADGDDVSSGDLTPGCYDLYVEDECGCYAYNSTDGNVRAGLEFTWHLTDAQMTCTIFTGC
jgi:hypothetical protein